MILVQRLKGAIKESGYSIEETAKKIGLSKTTMYRKIRAGDFSINEIDDMIEVLAIRHPEEIFIYGRKA